MIYTKFHRHGEHGVEVTEGRLLLTSEECHKLETGRTLKDIIDDRGESYKIEIKAKKEIKTTARDDKINISDMLKIAQWI